MKYIDKSNNRALAFMEALQQHLANNPNHPDYEKGSFRKQHYKDVFMALLFCQGGVCAYTEELMWKKARLIESDWQNGAYVGKIVPQFVDMDIEHFDPKTKKTKGWGWENLFVVGVAVNRKNKLASEVFDFFKPDKIDFDVSEYVNYNFETHKFGVKAKWNEQPDMKAKIKKMIQVLGLNYGTTQGRRESYFEDKKGEITHYNQSFEDVQKNLYQFFTAFALSKEYLENLINPPTLPSLP